VAPVTRNRADGEWVPTPSMVTDFAQRASAGLIVTEGTQRSTTGQGCPFTPGMHAEVQAAAWRQVTKAIYERCGRLLLQIMHSGRVAFSPTSR